MNNILLAYLAFATIILLQELVRAPQQWVVSFRYGLPVFHKKYSSNGYSQLLVAGVLLTVAYFLQPTIVFLQLLGVVSWVYFLAYSLITPTISAKDSKKPVFPKKGSYDGLITISVAVIVFVLTQEYFLQLIKTLFGL